MKATVKGNILTIVVELAKKPAPSKSGKSLLLASSGGFKYPEELTYLGKQVGLGLNVIGVEPK